VEQSKDTSDNQKSRRRRRREKASDAGESLELTCIYLSPKKKIEYTTIVPIISCIIPHMYKMVRDFLQRVQPYTYIHL